MKQGFSNRRDFLKTSAAASGMALLTGIQAKANSNNPSLKAATRIRFAVININHNHIYGMTEAVKRGGGELVWIYAKEPELVAAFMKQFPEAKLARSEQEVLEDSSLQLILSSGYSR